MSNACWAIPNLGYVAVGPLSSGLAITTEGPAPIYFYTDQQLDAKLYNGVWNFRSRSTPDWITGDSWLDGVYGTFMDTPAGLLQARKGVICAQTNTVTVNDTNIETSLVGSGFGTVVLPADFFKAGKSIRLTARGVISDTGTPTINIKFKMSGTVMVTTGAVTLATVSGVVWEADILLTYRGSNSAIAQGFFRVNNVTYGMPGTAQTVGEGDVHTMDLTATWGTTNILNTISSTNLVAEV